MKSYFAILLILLTYNQVMAQNNAGLLPVKINDKWGIIDLEGRELIPCKYEFISDFNRFGLATINANGKTGIISSKPEIIVDAEYQKFIIFDSVWVAGKNSKNWEIINTISKSKRSFDFDIADISRITYNLCRYQTGYQWGMMSCQGRLITGSIYDSISKTQEDNLISVFIKNKYGLIDTAGKEIIPPVYNQINIIAPSVFVAIDSIKKQLYVPNFQNTNSVFILKIKYFKQQGNFLFYSDSTSNWGVFSLLSKEIIVRPQYSKIELFEKYFIVYDNKLKGISDTLGNEIIKPSYEDIAVFNDNLFYIKKNNKTGLINRDNKIIVPPNGSRFEIHEKTIKIYEDDKLVVLELDDNYNIASKNEFVNFKSFTVKRNLSFDWNIGNIIRGNNDNNGNNSEGWFFGYGGWGLKDTLGQIKIRPVYSRINICEKQHFTIVYMAYITKNRNQLPSFGLGPISFPIEQTVGIYDHKKYKYLYSSQFWHIWFTDFEKGSDVARVLYEGGGFGLINKNGQSKKKAYTYIGDFHDSIARVAFSGLLRQLTPKDKDPIGNIYSLLSNIKRDLISRNV